jgi:cytochrome c biogenesis protein CcmG, thiol:disulfide interchange protein DsbE
VHDPFEHDGHRDPQVGGRPTPRRPILLALAIATVALIAITLVVGATRGGPKAVIGEPAPAIVGTTLDGAPFDLATLRGRPVIVNFWGPSCVPCRDEFPQFLTKLKQHGADGLAIVGVLTDDPEAPARDFIAQYGATWPTVIDPDKALKTAYRVAARPQTYFIDGQGVLRSIQIGQADEADFERQYAKIAP